MKKRSRLAVFVLYALLCAQGAMARHIQPEEWRHLANDKAFGYRNDVEAVAATTKNEWSMRYLEKVLSVLIPFFTSDLGLWLARLLVISLLVYIAYKLFLGANPVFNFRRRHQGNGDSNTADTEPDFEHANWQALMQQAADTGNYTQAIRYSYMWLLRLMQDRQLIQYRADKTNLEYYTELQGTAIRQPFRAVSRQYEYAWYGKFPVESDGYQRYLNQFNNLKKELGA